MRMARITKDNEGDKKMNAGYKNASPRINEKTGIENWEGIPVKDWFAMVNKMVRDDDVLWDQLDVCNEKVEYWTNKRIYFLNKIASLYKTQIHDIENLPVLNNLQVRELEIIKANRDVILERLESYIEEKNG